MKNLNLSGGSTQILGKATGNFDAAVRVDSREAWLNAVVEAMRPEFAARGYTLPAKVRVSIGFTSCGWRGKALGECWPRAASQDGTNEIFLNPTLVGDELIANVLTHELCHAVDDCKSKHGKAFKQCGAAMNLEGKAKHMLGGDAWRKWAVPLLDAVGPLPHGALAEYVAKPKTQTTRMHKLECTWESCGAVWRMAASHLLDTEGQPRPVRCPCCSSPVENPMAGDGLTDEDRVPEDQQ